MHSDPLLSAFERYSAERGDAPLAIASGQSLSAGDVGSLATRIAVAIDGAGLDEGEIVGLVAPNGPGFLAALLALRMKRFVVALLDPRTPDAGIGSLCGALSAGALLRCGSGWSTNPSASVRRLPAPAGTTSPAPPSGTAFIKLSSGSTGEPRGICVSAAGVAADEDALFRSMGLRPDDRMMAAIPMSHSYGFTTVAMTALVRGTPLIFTGEEGPFGMLEAASAAGATVLPTSPAYIHSLLRLSDPPRWPASLRLVISAGAPLQAAAATRFRETFGLPVHVFYGASECGGICYDREGSAGERGTVGEPVEGVRIELTPGDLSGDIAVGRVPGGTPESCGGNRNLPADGPGRDADEPGLDQGGTQCDEGTVTVTSPAVGLGYHPLPDPALAEGRFVSSDVARWHGGELMLCRRSDDLVKIRGKLVSPQEVDAVISRLGGVSESFTFAIIPRGGEESILRSLVACTPGAVRRTDVLDWCRQRLPEHKIPRSIVLVAEIPRTGRGKIDRAAVARISRE